MSDCNKCLIAYSTGIIINQLIASTGLSGLVRAAIHMNLCAVLGVLWCVVLRCVLWENNFLQQDCSLQLRAEN